MALRFVKNATTRHIVRKLTPKEKVFVDEYLVDLNPERAAKDAGYSKSVARTKAYLWVSSSKHKPHVFDAILNAQKRRSERTEITQDRVLKEYAKLAFLDPRRFYDDDGQLLQVHELPEDVAAALSSMEVVTEKAGDLELAVRKIKFSDKKAALDSIARHLGMFKDKTELTGDFPVLNLVLNGPGITRKAE